MKRRKIIHLGTRVLASFTSAAVTFKKQQILTISADNAISPGSVKTISFKVNPYYILK